MSLVLSAVFDDLKSEDNTRILSTHDPMLESDLSKILDEEESQNQHKKILLRLHESIYNRNVNGLEGQKEAISIALKLIVKVQPYKFKLKHSIMNQFSNIIERKIG